MSGAKTLSFCLSVQADASRRMTALEALSSDADRPAVARKEMHQNETWSRRSDSIGTAKVSMTAGWSFRNGISDRHSRRTACVCARESESWCARHFPVCTAAAHHTSRPTLKRFNSQAFSARPTVSCAAAPQSLWLMAER
jgi:hypothetical protein